MLPLAFAMIAGGILLVAAGATGSSLGSIVSGHPDAANAKPLHTTTGGQAAGVTGSTEAAGSEKGVGGTGLPAGALVRLRQIAAQRGWSVADWLGVINLESGGDPQSRNKETGAYGIGQINPENASNPFAPRPGSTAAQYPKYKGNATEQIEAMAEYIASRYGNPTAALAHEHAQHNY